MNVLFAKYKFLGVLGEGAFGKVYKVELRETGEIFALKTIDTTKLSESSIKSIYREFAVMERLGCRNNNIVCFKDIFESEFQGKDNIMVLMEYVEGYNLEKLYYALKEVNYPLSPGKLYKIIEQVLSALAYLESYGVAHRDIKDANIMFDEERIVLVDFGFSCLTTNTEEQDKWLKCDGIVGTPLFKAPEVEDGSIRNHPEWSGSSDVYSAGKVFWELATKQDPDGFNLPEIPLTYPKNIRDVVSSCLIQDPRKRPNPFQLLKILRNHEIKELPQKKKESWCFIL